MILARFVRREIKSKFVACRKQLKSVTDEQGNKVYKGEAIGDDLTKLRQQLMKVLEDDDTVSDVWSYGRKVYCKKSGADDSK